MLILNSKHISVTKQFPTIAFRNVRQLFDYSGSAWIAEINNKPSARIGFYFHLYIYWERSISEPRAWYLPSARRSVWIHMPSWLSYNRKNSRNCIGNKHVRINVNADRVIFFCIPFYYPCLYDFVRTEMSFFCIAKVCLFIRSYNSICCNILCQQTLMVFTAILKMRF